MKTWGHAHINSNMMQAGRYAPKSEQVSIP